MKQDRIELRTNQKERERLLEAAVFTGMTLSAFLRQAALEKSDEILKSRDAITLSDRDRNLFLETLENPPKTHRRLQQAFKTYQKLKNNVITDTSARKPNQRSKKNKQSIA